MGAAATQQWSGSKYRRQQLAFADTNEAAHNISHVSHAPAKSLCSLHFNTMQHAAEPHLLQR
jgi:hypothetical protein